MKLPKDKLEKLGREITTETTGSKLLALYKAGAEIGVEHKLDLSDKAKAKTFTDALLSYVPAATRETKTVKVLASQITTATKLGQRFLDTAAIWGADFCVPLNLPAGRIILRIATSCAKDEKLAAKLTDKAAMVAQCGAWKQKQEADSAAGKTISGIADKFGDYVKRLVKEHGETAPDGAVAELKRAGAIFTAALVNLEPVGKTVAADPAPPAETAAATTKSTGFDLSEFVGQQTAMMGMMVKRLEAIEKRAAKK